MSEPSELFKLMLTRDLIESMRGGSTRRLRWDDLYDQVDLILEGFNFRVYKFDQEVKLYRGRKLRSADPYPNVGDTGARSAADIHDFGRCHKPGRSVLYLSSNKETVMSELRSDVGDRIQIAEYTIRPEDDISYAIIGEFDFVRRHGHGMFGNLEGGQGIKDFVMSLSEIARLRLHLTDAFMAECFRQVASSQRDYKVTSAISEQYFSIGCDGFVYPSVQHLGGVNFALTGDKIDKCEGTEISVVEITDASGYGIYENAKVSEARHPIGTPIDWDKYEGKLAYFRDFLEFLKMALSYGPKSMILCLYLKILPDEFRVTLEFAGRIHKGMTLDGFIKYGLEQGADFDLLGFSYGAVTGDDEAEGIRAAREHFQHDNLRVATFDKSGKIIPIPYQKAEFVKPQQDT